MQSLKSHHSIALIGDECFYSVGIRTESSAMEKEEELTTRMLLKVQSEDLKRT